MDGGERKRKKNGSQEGDQDGGGDGADEEEKMEMFFALIRSTKEVLQSFTRDSRETAGVDDEERTKKAAIWTPTFLPEDFMGDDKSLGGTVSGVQAGPSNCKEEDGKAKREEPKEDDDLDLKLSL